MCGIIAAISQNRKKVKSILINGLKKLEYRGYDSAGICLLKNNQFINIKNAGKLEKLKNKIAKDYADIDSHIGIGHTRWATHGLATDNNAHPHVVGNYAIVHNGVIENFEFLKQKITPNKLKTQTDTEIIAQLINQLEGDNLSKLAQIYKTLSGSFSCVIADSQDSDHLYAIKEKSPMIIGQSSDGVFIASDINAISDFVEQVIYLEDGDLVQISKDSIKLFDDNLKPIKRTIHKHTNNNINTLSKEGFNHFMEKEIYEQPQAIENTICDKLGKNQVLENIFGVESSQILKKIKNIHLIGCGSSFNAALLAKYWLEDLTHIPTQAENASEYLYRKVPMQKDSLIIALSQSGETADIISAIKKAKKDNQSICVLAICNTANSELVRRSDLVFLTQAGTEISVASTKAFTTQLCGLMLLCLSIMAIQKINLEKIASLVNAFRQIPARINKIIENKNAIEKLAEKLIDKKSALFVARGMLYPIAIEGALKLKEISYIHAQAYAAGELKHGPLALIDANMPVIAIVDENNLYEKIKSSLMVVSARGGELFTFSNERVQKRTQNKNIIFIENNFSSYLSPILFSVCLQLLAYYVAKNKGTDIDQPRNLAKSVTVE